MVCTTIIQKNHHNKHTGTYILNNIMHYYSEKKHHYKHTQNSSIHSYIHTFIDSGMHYYSEKEKQHETLPYT